MEEVWIFFSKMSAIIQILTATLVVPLFLIISFSFPDFVTSKQKFTITPISQRQLFLSGYYLLIQPEKPLG